MKNSKILITGGHLTPALAVVDELKKQGFHKIIWIGTKYNQAGNKNLSPEFNIITSKKIKFYDIKAGKLSRTWSLKTIWPATRNFIFILIGFINSFIILLKERPKIIVSFGGYIALPIVIVGKLMKIKTVTHEQTLTIGLANKIISKFADKIFVSWPDSLKHFPKEKTILTGNPIRKEILKRPKKSQLTSFENNLPIILITGGNQGANFINKNIFEILPKLLKKYNVIHQTGNSSVTLDYEKALNIKKELNDSYNQRYKVFTYLNASQMSEALWYSDLVISRAGANTVTELALLGKKTILIPIPWGTNNEQYKNAKFLEKNLNAVVLEQNNTFTSENLLATINSYIKKTNPKPLDIPKNAQQKICEHILLLLKNN
jgi:UDP-N-acetylglucosamine--N-acetylmuramyl-(pentapeptide) pyrophosphoryl-undecaprenol N-acetylglucosamine transferase